MEMKSKYDIVIIGSGLGGLGAGLILTKQNPNLRVLIVEQHTIPGGYVTGFYRKGYYFDPGAEGISSMYEGSTLRKTLNEIGFQQEYIKIDPLETYYFDDGKKIALYYDIEKFLIEVEAAYPEEKKGTEDFLNECNRILGKKMKGEDIEEYKDWSFYDLLKKYVKNDNILDIFNLFCLWFSEPIRKMKAKTGATLVSNVMKTGVVYPKGGMANFSKKLADLFVSNGGTIIYGKKATNILIEDHIVTGILLNDGKEVKCDYVISNADVKKTMLEYIEEKYLDNDYLKFIRDLKQSHTGVMLFLGVDMDLSMYPSHFQISEDIDGIDRIKKNILEIKKLAVRIPAIKDPSLLNDGKYSIVAFFFSPYDWNNMWNSGPGGKRTPEYRKLKDDLMNQMITKIETIIPKLKENIDIRILATPLTFDRYVMVSEGAWFGPNSFSKLPGIKTPIKNLFLVGASVEGSGVPSALSSGFKVGKILSAIFYK
ncbi:phytoene desaturase family protein [Promethearchaeum syntrophicum]|uniref:Phytoene desaturase family protein n=1 Tax=Promethearchaeum syntrophicum TaxID=2594042 RepID=A0A5B9DFL3_9ARCH|nr:NAD(P)/FAD-dependent oxidoreductase [Candidatus Prometheoarchaeum syntrophicum]QEE17526.1 protoporphyrinogen oxidase [Candidatus Prometheoarchaeum syntrophicum]